MNLLRLGPFLLEGTFFIMAFGAYNENVMKPIDVKMCVQLCARTVGCHSAIYTTPDLLYEIEQETVNITGVRTCQCHIFKPRDIGYQEMDNCSRGSILFHSRAGHTLCKQDLTPNSTKSIKALHLVCKEGNLNMVKYIISHRLAGVNCVKKYGKTPVMNAARKGRLCVFDFLVRQGALLNGTNRRGHNVLHEACKGGNIQIVQRLLNHSDIERRSSDGYTPFMFAVYHCHRNIYNFLLQKRCDFAAVSSDKESILMLSCKCGNVDVVKDMLKLNASSVNARDVKGETAVMKAAGAGHLEIVKLLVKEGCNLTVVDKNNASVLHKACEGGHSEIVKYLVSQSAGRGLKKTQKQIWQNACRHGE